MRTIPHIAVEIDPETGEWWNDTLRFVGHVDSDVHDRKEDTDHIHYDKVDPAVLPRDFFNERPELDGVSMVAVTCVFA